MSGLNRMWQTAALAAMLLAGTGCGGPPGVAPEGSACMPPPFSLSSDTIAAGGSLTVKAADATCDPRYGTNAQIHIEIVDGSGEKILETVAPMNDAGGFSATVNVPDSAVPGQVAVNAYPLNLDWCDDTGRNNRISNQGAVSGDAATGIERVSCVMPSEPLTIEP